MSAVRFRRAGVSLLAVVVSAQAVVAQVVPPTIVLGAAGDGGEWTAGSNGAPPEGAAQPEATLAASKGEGCHITLCNTGPFCDPTGTRRTACLKIEFRDLGWRVCVENQGAKGLWLGNVELRSSSTHGWTTLLKAAGPVEVFTGYHEGPPDNPYNPPRLFDTRWCNPIPGCLNELKASDLPPTGGFLLTLKNDTAPRLMVECRQRGIAWLCQEPLSGQWMIRRGQEVAIWGVYDAGNYDFITEYTFRDDGSIGFRMGATGSNLSEPPGPKTAHMHDVLWRVDMDLAGPLNDEVLETFHLEPIDSQHPLNAIDDEFPYNGGFEGPLDWDPLSFTTVLVEDAVVTNAHGNAIGYEFVPWNRLGTARHFGPWEAWTQHDFWVTLMHPGEDGSGAPPINDWGTAWHFPDIYLLRYAQTDATHDWDTGPEELTSAGDPVIWYNAFTHHDPHDEDRSKYDTGSQVDGITLVHWFGFDLQPHNFFDHNPLGGECKCTPNRPPQCPE